MGKIKLSHFILLSIVLVILTGCTLPGFSTPTPFTFPTPDKTMTALFEPTQEVPATSAADDGDQATATLKVVPTNTPEPEETQQEDATETPEPTDTEPTEVSYVGPAVRSGPSIVADYTTIQVMDGNLAGWEPPIQKVINHVVYGANKWANEEDCSGTVVAGWDEDFLYLGVRVKDGDYVQEATKEKLYLGDSIEILFDRYVSADYYLQAMTADDYQIGISPGKGEILSCTITNGKVAVTCDPNPPEAYVWFPKANSGTTDEISIGAEGGESGYMVEFKIPWELIGVTNPAAGDHYGFAISISDNDTSGTKQQQSMVSNVPTRYFADPTTWGDLYLRKE